MDTLTLQGLIQHFEGKIRQMDRQDLGYGAGSGPHYPMLVVYLGERSMLAHAAISSALFQVWPQYQGEIQFLGVQEPKGDYSCIVSGTEGKTWSPAMGDLTGIVSKLLGTKTHFQARDQILVYYILDTTEVKEAAGLDLWLSRCQSIQQDLGADSIDLLNMLILLLNEDLLPAHQAAARDIRNRLCAYDSGDDKLAFNSILLLSNRRSDNAILEDLLPCYQLAAAVVELSNNRDSTVLQHFFRRSILTAGYAREEKPISQIAQVVIGDLLEWLQQGGEPAAANLFRDENSYSRLGLDSDGCFTVLNNYADHTLLPLLPTPEQLGLFPRQAPQDEEDLAAYSGEEFNRFTMGGWNCFLQQLLQRVFTKMGADSSIEEGWKQRYRDFLIQSLSKGEILSLANHEDQLRELIGQHSLPQRDLPVLDAADRQLKRGLSENPELQAIFLTAIREQSAQIEKFQEQWNQLLQSRWSVFQPGDQNISVFYSQKVRNYLNRKGVGLKKDFDATYETSRLAHLLTAAIDEIVEGDPIFAASFEDELNSRLNADTLGTDAQRYIRSKLTGSNVYTYLQGNFSFGHPVFSAVLLKRGTPLHQSLTETLSADTYYYDTGNGSAAETVVVYRLKNNDLING